MSELASGPAIQSGTAAGLMEFTDWVPEKGYGSSAAWGPLKSAARQILGTVEGTDDFKDVDVRGLDLDEYLARYETKARGRIKAESISSYRSRFTRAVEAYRHFLDTGQPPRTPTRRTARDDAAPAPPAAAASRRSPSPPRTQQTATGPDGNAGDRLIDYPFPLRSGQIALLRLPVSIEKSDAERLATFIRTLVLDPQLQLTQGGGNTSSE